MSDDVITTEQEGGKLPIDLRTLLIGIWRRRWFMLIMLALTLALAWTGGRALNRSTYQTATVMLYKPAEEKKREILDLGKELMTQRDMVKVKPTLEATRRALNLAVTLDQLGSSIKVDVEKNTNILVITVDWDDPQVAADIANTVRDQFLNTALRIDREAARNQIRDVTKRLNTVNAQLAKADDALNRFVERTKYTEFVEMSKSALDQFNQMDLLWEQAKSDRKTVALQVKNLDRIIDQLKERVAQERTSMVELDRLSNINTRIQNLREKIQDDRALRINVAELAQKELELARAKRLLDAGAISEQQYEAARLAYERQRVATVDNEAIKQWKEQLEQLYKVVIPSANSNTPTGDLLQDMLKREFELQLEMVALDIKEEHFKKARDEATKRINALPEQQRTYIVLTREVANLETERDRLLEILGKAKRYYGSESYDFVVISEAKPPALPIKSNRKTLTIIIAFLGFVFTIGSVLVLEVGDLTIKSAPDLTAKLGLAVLGVLPRLRGGAREMPGPRNTKPPEEFSVIARLIRQAVPEQGARILITCSRHGEGVTYITAHVAAALARQDEHVLVIDGADEEAKSKLHMTDLLPETPSSGLSDLLAQDAELETRADSIICATSVPGLFLIPRVGAPVHPDMLSSRRMQKLLEHLSSRFGVVILEAPPVLENVDAELLAQHSQGAVLVVRANDCKAPVIRKARDRLQLTGVPIIGAVVNQVDTLFLD